MIFGWVLLPHPKVNFKFLRHFVIALNRQKCELLIMIYFCLSKLRIKSYLNFSLWIAYQSSNKILGSKLHTNYSLLPINLNFANIYL